MSRAGSTTILTVRSGRVAPEVGASSTVPSGRLTGTTVTAVACLTLGALILGGQDAAAVPAPADSSRAVAGQVLEPLGRGWGGDTSREDRRAGTGNGAWKADRDLGSAWSIADEIGAHDVWVKRDPSNSRQRLTGFGVGVAVIDTGIAPVEGLATPGKVVNGPDLSFESQSDDLRYLDGNGHGTYMAGLIAGRDSDVRPGRESQPKHFVGMAPDATLVNVRVGTTDGAVDASQVIAGIDWVVANREAHNIRVLNLSYGTSSTQDPVVDPLAHAVQNAWRAGIVVVAAVGNEGDAGPTPVTMPAADPFVIAVGSTDYAGSSDPADRTVGSWTNSGTDARRPDLLAPGKSVVSLRVPGSFIDVMNPEGRVGQDRSGRMLRGTGTSQSAAVVSGAAALLLQRNPELTPDQVKGLLVASADAVPSSAAGALDVSGAVERLEVGALPAYTQNFPPSTGLGSLDAARGGDYVVDPRRGTALRGEVDTFGVAWDAPSWAPLSAAGSAWEGGDWRGTTLAGNGWVGQSWAPAAWSGFSWSGFSWSGFSWSGFSWSGFSWSGESWG